MQTKNKTAVVTGAGKGIGKGIAIALAKEGYNIVVSDIILDDCENVAGQIKETGIQALAVKCDVSRKDEVGDLFSKVAEKFGGVDILVNNAGIYPSVSFEKMSEDDWDQVMNINLKGMFFCTKEALKKMPEGGRIINISSIAAEVGFFGLVHYCASKGGVNAFTRALSLELAQRKITVNAVAPGAIDTPGAKSDEGTKKQTIAAIPLKRMGQPEDIANAVAFLASKESGYITGQTIIVDGGWTSQ